MEFESNGHSSNQVKYCSYGLNTVYTTFNLLVQENIFQNTWQAITIVAFQNYDYRCSTISINQNSIDWCFKGIVHDCPITFDNNLYLLIDPATYNFYPNLPYVSLCAWIIAGVFGLFYMLKRKRISAVIVKSGEK